VRLNAKEAEHAAAVMEMLFADLEDLREFARHHDGEHVGIRTRESEARVTWLNVMSAATGGDLYGVDEGLRAVAEDAVYACIPVLPITGSLNSGYEISERIDVHVLATVEEWWEAAHQIVALHKRLRGTDAPSDGVHQPGEPGADEDRTGVGDPGDHSAPEAPED